MKHFQNLRVALNGLLVREGMGELRLEYNRHATTGRETVRLHPADINFDGELFAILKAFFAKSFSTETQIDCSSYRPFLEISGKNGGAADLNDHSEIDFVSADYASVVDEISQLARDRNLREWVPYSECGEPERKAREKTMSFGLVLDWHEGLAEKLGFDVEPGSFLDRLRCKWRERTANQRKLPPEPLSDVVKLIKQLIKNDWAANYPDEALAELATHASQLHEVVEREGGCPDYNGGHYNYLAELKTLEYAAVQFMYRACKHLIKTGGILGVTSKKLLETNVEAHIALIEEYGRGLERAPKEGDILRIRQNQLNQMCKKTSQQLEKHYYWFVTMLRLGQLAESGVTTLASGGTKEAEAVIALMVSKQSGPTPEACAAPPPGANAAPTPQADAAQRHRSGLFGEGGDAAATRMAGSSGEPCRPDKVSCEDGVLI